MSFKETCKTDMCLFLLKGEKSKNVYTKNLRLATGLVKTHTNKLDWESKNIPPGNF